MLLLSTRGFVFVCFFGWKTKKWHELKVKNNKIRLNNFAKSQHLFNNNKAVSKTPIKPDFPQ